MSGHKMPDRRDDDDGGGQGQQQDSVAEAMAAAHIANALGGSNNNTTSTNTSTNSNTAANVPSNNNNGSMFQSNLSPSSSSSNNNNILPRVPKCIFAPVSTSSTSSISNPFFSVPKQPSRPNTSVVVRASPPIDAAICPLPKMVLSPQQTSQSAKFGTPPTFAPLAPCSVGAFDPRLAGRLSKTQRPQSFQSPKGLPTSKEPTTKTPSKIRPFQTMSPKEAMAIRSPAPLPSATSSQKEGDIVCLGKTAMRTYSQRANDKQKQKIAPKILPSPSPASKPPLTTTIERVPTDTESDDDDEGGNDPFFNLPVTGTSTSYSSSFPAAMKNSCRRAPTPHPAAAAAAKATSSPKVIFVNPAPEAAAAENHEHSSANELLTLSECSAPFTDFDAPSFSNTTASFTSQTSSPPAGNLVLSNENGDNGSGGGSGDQNAAAALLSSSNGVAAAGTSFHSTINFSPSASSASLASSSAPEAPAAENSADNIPAENSAHIPAETLVHIPAETPVHIPAETLVHIPAETLVHISAETPAHIPAETPAHISAENLAHIPAETPAHIPAETPAHISAETPDPIPADYLPASAPKEPSSTVQQSSSSSSPPPSVDDNASGGDHSSSATQQCFEINGNLFAHIHPPPLLTPHHLTVLNGSLAKARKEHPIQERAPEQLPWQNFTLKNHHHQGLLTTRDQFTLEPLTLGPEVFEMTSEAGGEHGTRNSASVIKVSVTETIRFHVERKVKLIFESPDNGGGDKKVVVTGENDGNPLMTQVTDDHCPVGATVPAAAAAVAVVPAQGENESENEPRNEVEEGGGKISDRGDNNEPMDIGANQQNSIVNGELEVEPNVTVTGQNSDKTSTGNNAVFAENGEKGGEQGAIIADDADLDEIGGSGDQSGVVSLEQLEQLPVSHIFAAGDETFAKVNDDNDIVPPDEAAASSSATENGATDNVGFNSHPALPFNSADKPLDKDKADNDNFVDAVVDDLPHAAAAAADKQNKVEAKEDNDKKDNHDDQCQSDHHHHHHQQEVEISRRSPKDDNQEGGDGLQEGNNLIEEHFGGDSAGDHLAPSPSKKAQMECSSASSAEALHQKEKGKGKEGEEENEHSEGHIDSSVSVPLDDDDDDEQSEELLKLAAQSTPVRDEEQARRDLLSPLITEALASMKTVVDEDRAGLVKLRVDVDYLLKKVNQKQKEKEQKNDQNQSSRGRGRKRQLPRADFENGSQQDSDDDDELDEPADDKTDNESTGGQGGSRGRGQGRGRGRGQRRSSTSSSSRSGYDPRFPKGELKRLGVVLSNGQKDASSDDDDDDDNEAGDKGNGKRGCSARKKARKSRKSTVKPPSFSYKEKEDDEDEEDEDEE